MQALEFPRGQYYNIICKGGDFSLRIKATNVKEYEESQVFGVELNPQDDGQLFMIEKVGKDEDEYEIVNVKSNLVLEEESKQIRLGLGKQKSYQLFAMVKANVQAFYQYYWIKTSAKGDKALSLEGILRYGNFDPNSENQLFRFQKVKANDTILKSALLINNLSGKALDVPEGTFKKDVRIVQWEINRRFNQRWVFIKHDKGYLIQNVLNGHLLDISGESRDNGAKVIIWEKTGNPNQQWTFQGQGNGIYKIRSIHEHTLFLAIKNQDVEDGGKLEVSKDENPSMYWKIEGALP